MGDIEIKRLPMAINDFDCPICNNTMRECRKFMICMDASERHPAERYKCRTLYCTTCKIPFINDDLRKEFYRETGRKLKCFYVGENTRSRDKVYEVMSHGNDKGEHCDFNSSKEKKSAHGNAGKCEYAIVDRKRKVFNMPNSIVGKDNIRNVCPKCHSALKGYRTLIPMSETQSYEIPGLWCRNCNVIVREGWGQRFFPD